MPIAVRVSVFTRKTFRIYWGACETSSKSTLTTLCVRCTHVASSTIKSRQSKTYHSTWARAYSSTRSSTWPIPQATSCCKRKSPCKSGAQSCCRFQISQTPTPSHGPTLGKTTRISPGSSGRCSVPHGPTEASSQPDTICLSAYSRATS